jgi:transcriptional regulator of acetoin/glycerol metabolism
MPASSWEYDRASGKSNASSGVLASISESWSRCRDFGLRAAGTPQEIVLSEDKFKVVLEKNESIRNFVLPELELLYNQIAGTNFMVAYADGGGIVLDSIQDHDFKAGEGGKAVIPGSVWIENHRGTNALGLAIHTRKPSIVTGKDHFFHKLDDLSCFAVPIFDHEETLLGVIDATSNAKARNDHTLALVKLASKNIENRLFTERFCDSIILTFHARQEYLPTTSAAMLAVDEYGFIEGANANAKSVLSGLDVSRQQHFGEIFDVQFFDVIDKLRSNEIISIKDRLGAVVFMRAQHSVSKKVINLEGDLLISNGKAQPLSNEKPSSNLLIAGEATKVTTVFDDELLTKEILEAKRTLEVGLPVTILGSSSTGKTEIAKEINNQAFGKSKFTTIDCIHLDPERFETLLFGENGKVVFLTTIKRSQVKENYSKLVVA